MAIFLTAASEVALGIPVNLTATFDHAWTPAMLVSCFNLTRKFKTWVRALGRMVAILHGLTIGNMVASAFVWSLLPKPQENLVEDTFDTSTMCGHKALRQGDIDLSVGM